MLEREDDDMSTSATRGVCCPFCSCLHTENLAELCPTDGKTHEVKCCECERTFVAEAIAVITVMYASTSTEKHRSGVIHTPMNMYNSESKTACGIEMAKLPDEDAILGGNEWSCLYGQRKSDRALQLCSECELRYGRTCPQGT